MAGKQEGKPLSFKGVEMMKPGDKDKADVGENRGLRVSCGATGVKSFFYRYTSPLPGKLAQVKIGNFPQTSLAAARLKLHELKLLRQEGRCPASELKQDKLQRAIEAEQAKIPELTVQGLVELYLTERIEDRKTKDGKVIPGARKPKGQAEVRRTLYGDAVKSLGTRNAAEITRQDVINLINGIVARGATVQAGNVLRELSLAYEFAIGLGRTGEVCNMAWKDVDLEKGTIHLRETKTGVERYVQLSDQAIDFLKVLRLTSDKYLFPSQATKKPIQQKYLTENSWRLRESGQMLDIPHWTPHDLRRTVRTGLSRLQCPNEVAEAVLGHTRGGVEGIYNLYKYDAECRKWLQVWADYLDTLT